ETFKCTELDSEEGKVDLELLQKLVAACDDLILELTLSPEIETADGICTLGPYCENRCEIKRDEKKELEVEMDKYEDERKEEEEDLPNKRIRVAEIGSADEMNTVVPCCENGVEVEKDKTKAYEVEVDKNKDEIDKKDNEDFEVVDKTAKMDYVEGTFESSLETGIDVVIEILWKHRKPTGMDSERKLNKLEEVSLEEKFVDDEPPDESDCDTELTEGTVKVRDCSQGRIEVKIDGTKSPVVVTTVACRMDSSKEKKEEKGKKIVRNSEMPQKNQGLGYLPINGLFTPIFDPEGGFRFAFKLKQPIVGVGN
ncbi:hypothetical protein C2G38_2295064, partial [Gigaspora rosea]